MNRHIQVYSHCFAAANARNVSISDIKSGQFDLLTTLLSFNKFPPSSCKSLTISHFTLTIQLSLYNAHSSNPWQPLCANIKMCFITCFTRWLSLILNVHHNASHCCNSYLICNHSLIHHSSIEIVNWQTWWWDIMRALSLLRNSELRHRCWSLSF